MFIVLRFVFFVVNTKCGIFCKDVKKPAQEAGFDSEKRIKSGFNAYGGGCGVRS